MADLSNLSDGTYGRELGRISPEGNMYGATRWVRDVLRNFWWNGAEWLEIGWDIGQSASVSLLPTATQDSDTVWRCLDRVENGTYIWKYFFWDADTDGWLPIEWYWTVESRQELDNITAYRRGEAHEVREPDVQAMWDGYTWRRVRISSLDDDLGVMSSLAGLEATTQEQQDDHSLLLESYLGSTSTGNTLLDAIATEKAGFLSLVNSFSTDTTLMLSEANTLSASFATLTIGYSSIVASAALCDPAVSTVLFEAAYDALDTELTTKWIGQASYPVTLGADDRGDLTLLLQAYEEKRYLTESAIAAANVGDPTQEIADAINNFKLSIYNGFVPGWTPELEMAYISKNEIGLKPKTVVGETADETAIRKQLATILEKSSVHIYTPVLDYTAGPVLSFAEIEEKNTTDSYYVYLANQHEDFATSIYDYRGKLFCSTITPSDNLWINSGDFEAILIGTVETQTELGKIVFEHEYGTSLVSRESDVKETFREYSDFDLSYTDEDTITLERIYGTYGQIYVPERLYYIGESKEVTISDWTVKVNIDNTLSLDTEGVSASTLYYTYIGSDTDIYNFNALAGTQPDRPLHPGETGYDADKDFRLDIFLSTQPPDNMRLAETYYGYWARHIGQVRTDTTGKFIYSGGVSAIRQATLNPTYFDGLAEMTLEYTSTSEIRVIRRRGTSGIIMVGGRGVQLYNSSDVDVHKIIRTSPLYVYTEANTSQPLSLSGTQLLNYPTTPVYLYIANDRPCWGSLSNQLFLSLSAPNDAYLSANFPGNNARWVATIDVDSSGYFTGSYITDSINQPMLVIDDVTVSPNTLWSSYKNQQMMDGYYNQLASLISAQNLFTVEQSNGIGVGLYYLNSTTVILYPTSGANTSIVFPNLTTLTVTPSGISGSVDGVTGIQKFIWVYKTGITANATLPSQIYTGLAAQDDTKLLVGYVGSYDGADNDSVAYHLPSGFSAYGSWYSLNYVASKAFNLTCSGEEDCWISQGLPMPYRPEVLGISLPTAVVINKYGICGRDYSIASYPRQWELQGSNNGSVWVTLDYRSGISEPSRGQWLYFTFLNSSPFSQYRLRILERNGAQNWVAIGEFKLITRESDSTITTYSQWLFDTSRLTHYGVGANNPNTIPIVPSSATATSTLDSRYLPMYAFNGIRGEVGACWISSGGPVQSIMAHFSTPKLINKYAMSTRTCADPNSIGFPTSWQLQGTNSGSASVSDAEGANGWTTLDYRSGVSQPYMSMATPYFTFTNTVQYLYYRFRVLSHTGSWVEVGNIYLIEGY